MFTWAVINYDYTVLEIKKATIEVAHSRAGWWVIVPDGTKNNPNLIYSPTMKVLENG